MSETEEPPAKVLKIDNFDQELSIPDIEPIGNGSTIPDGLGDAASVVDGDVPDRLQVGDEDAEVTGETGDNDLTDAEDKETEQYTTDPDQGTDKTEQDITDIAAQLTDDILDQDNEAVDQELDNTDQETDKSGLDMENLDQSLEKLQDTDKTDQDESKTHQDANKSDQETDKPDQDAGRSDQDADNPDQDGDKAGQSLVTDQDASGSQEEVEGQEEWLSEGILTDDDLNANASTNQSEYDKPLHKLVQLESRIVEQNIEETLNHLDGSTSIEQDGGNDGVMDKKSDKNMIIKRESPTIKEEAEDGNDTDDLLRMLGEDDSKKSKKKLTKTVKDLRNAIKNVIEASDDEEFEYDETSIRKLKVTKNAISKKAPPKAVPEDMDDGDDDDTDQSSDEALATIKKSFNVKKTNILSRKLPPRETQNLVVVKKASTNKQTLAVNRRDIVSGKPLEKKSSSLIKPSTRSILKTSTPAKMVASKPNTDKTRIEFKPPTNIKTTTPFRPGSLLKTIEIKKEEMEDEFLEEEDYAMNDDFDSDIDDDLKSHQRIMKPERMDEEVPSDGDSCDEDGSLYDELPSSESDDMDDWFHIDIRAERASDYIPLLGSQAKEVLTQEKKRSSLRVANLRQSLSALTESGKKQAEELRKATMALAELDDLLKAS